ncbi:MAG TPA: sulfatase-like hydrolase/transferase [Planctomycetes bacterium]|nr:sulfatase-like hydrolase/transferase [Planctomycetota bacterium]
MDRTDIMSEQWDCLIILDACRYDYFDRLHRKYFDGRLMKKTSIGSCTNEWRDKSFPDYYDDVVYISANPQISANLPVYGYLASEHFHKVHEIWKTGWDSETGTVLPETLTKAAVEIIKDNPGKRFIIHYLQPHAPYLMPEIEPHGYDTGDIHAPKRLAGSDKYGKSSALKKWLLKNLLKLFKNTNILTNYPEWILRQLLLMPPGCAMDAARRKYGRKMLPKAYEATLDRTLAQVAVLLKHLTGRIVITADHGELLGENRLYAHPYGSLNPTLIEVPWLIIEKGQKDTDTEKPSTKIEFTHPGADEKPSQRTAGPADGAETETEQEELKRKLKSLGYYD